MFLDIDMPVIDGIDACRQLRADRATNATTIVMLTAAHGDEVQCRAAAAGADLYLTKPFSPLELLRLVDRLGEHSCGPSSMRRGQVVARDYHRPGGSSRSA